MWGGAVGFLLAGRRMGGAGRSGVLWPAVAIAAVVLLGVALAGVSETRRAGSGQRVRLALGALVGVVALAGAVLIVVLTAVGALGTRIAGEGLDRVPVWEATAGTISERPWASWGAGTSSEAYSLHGAGPPARTAHNVFLQLGVDTGVPACLLLVIAVVALLWPRWKRS